MVVDEERLVSHEIHLKQRPIGMPTESNFELVKVNVSDLKDGEFLVRNIWMSVDPYMRGRMKETKSYIPSFQLGKPLEGGCIGQIIKSKNNQFVLGEYVLGNFGWRDYWISNDSNDVMKIDPNMTPIQWYLGILGMTGLTAYVGLLKIGELKGDDGDNNTIFVSAASGAVGSVACQIAKIKGFRVVGSAGSQEKVKWLLDQAVIDYAFNYKEVGENNISSELQKACPNGIDIYFDNVGGKHLEAAIDNMNTFGRIVLCGATSQYSSISVADENDKLPQYQGPSNLHLAISNRLRLQGFLYSDHYDILDEFQTSMSKWIKENRIKWKETVYEGLENAPKAFIGLFKGENFG
ncbi:MAG TPA: NADP-dependent oxidoreductase, partial [Nitrososphaeraceae archaeon]|nr:NADP-dependent oxidoreductase [Nitrososphaeraceae archaeon]